MTWDKEKIQALLDSKPEAVIRGLRAVAALQTADEAAGAYTRESNGVGFSKHDAPFLTDMLRQLQAGRTLSPKQFAVTKNKVKRYWRQLAEIANAKAAGQPSAALESFDAGIRQQTNKVVKARNEILEMLDCTCAENEWYDGEDVCPACKMRDRNFMSRHVEGSW